MIWGTPRVHQGQIVTVSYGWHNGNLYRRVRDRSDGATSYDRAVLGRRQRERLSAYDPGGADRGPGVGRWVPTADPDA